jgi:hypothetical protein
MTIKFDSFKNKFPLIILMLNFIFCFFISYLSLKLTDLKVSLLQFLIIVILISWIFSRYVFKLPFWIQFIGIVLPVFFFIGLTGPNINANYYGVVFVILFFTFSNSFKDRVPLYLSNQVTIKALQDIIIKTQAKTFVDLGAGLGNVVKNVSKLKIRSVGVESAPIPWAIASLLNFNNGQILRQNIWTTDLSEFDVCYAFLSTAVMTKLYAKVSKEMKPGSLFISNSFAVEGSKYDELLELNDSRKTLLFIYKIN